MKTQKIKTLCRLQIQKASKAQKFSQERLGLARLVKRKDSVM